MDNNNLNVKIVEPFLILKGYGGSISYGTNNKNSDIDVKGIYIPPKEYWLGLKTTEHVRSTDPNDIFFHSLKKFLQLALNNNPNILELLYLRENHYLWKDLPENLAPIGDTLIRNRELFLSKKCKHTYLGYAYEQFSRMNRLNKNVNQNKKRLELVKKFGYDTKNAMHMIRLLRTGMEILTEHTVSVFRKDAKELLDIRAGKYTYNELKEEFDRYKELFEQAYVSSTLQHAPNYDKINELCIELVERAFEIFKKRT